MPRSRRSPAQSRGLEIQSRRDIADRKTSVLNSYLPALVFVGLGPIVGGAFPLLNKLFGRSRNIPSKQDPYECGLPSEVQQGFRFGISFYLIAMLFILFDIEVIFLSPVAMRLS